MCKGNKKNPEETEPNPGILAPEAKVLMRKKIFCFLAVLGMESNALYMLCMQGLVSSQHSKCQKFTFYFFKKRRLFIYLLGLLRQGFTM